MKYLAILKDSLLEALDTKVFYAMAGLSCLVILLVASVSYHPVTVEGEVQKLADTMTWVFNVQGKDKQEKQGVPTELELVEFQQTNLDAPPWEGNYRFTLVLHFANEDAAKRKGPFRNILPMAIKNSFPYLDNLRVTDGPAPDAQSIRFDVTTHGTTIKGLEEWPHEPTVLFALPLTFIHWPIGDFVRLVERWFVGFFGGAAALLLSTVITAFFIPNMLRKGTVDMLIVKPIHRSTILIYKYVGGLAFIFLNTAFVVLGIWIVLGMRTGLWGTGFLASIVIITYQFALYYAFSTLFGVITRSPIVSILVTVLAWFLIGLVAGYGCYLIDETRAERRGSDADEEMKFAADNKPQAPPTDLFPKWVYTTTDIVHFVTPRVKDLDVLSGKLIADDTLPSYSKERKSAEKDYARFSWTEAITVTSIYIVLLLAISCWWFATKDY